MFTRTLPTLFTLLSSVVHVVPSHAAQPTTPTLSGIVRDATGAAVAGASIASGAVSTVSGADGRFVLALPVGPRTVVVSAPGFASRQVSLTVDAAGTNEIEVTLDVAGFTDTSVVVGRDYRVTGTDTGSRVQTPILRVPQPIQVVTAQVIADQRPLILSDALRNVSGFSSLRNSAEVFRSFSIRGFNTLDIAVDGLRNTYGLNDQPDAVAHIERIDVAKGPAAAIYGRGGLGGTVNVVTKSPERERQARVSFSTGSWGLVQPTIDVTGAVNGSGTVRARAVLDFENRDTPIDFVSVERFQIAPSVEFDLGRSTTVLFKTDYRRREGVRFVALPAYGTVVGVNDFSTPYNLFIGEPSAGATVNTGWQSTARMTHRLSTTWSLVAAARLTANTLDMPSVGPRALQADNRTLTRRFTRFDETEREVALDAWTTGTFRTGAIQHTLVAGVDWAAFEYDSQFFSGGIAPLNIAAPVYDLPVTGVFLLDHTIDRIGGTAAYVQDQVALSPRLDATVGVRYDRIEKAREFVVESREADRVDDAFSPRVGVSFRPVPAVAVFGSYGEGLVGVADGTANQSGRPFRAQQGRQWEGGVKVELAGAVSLTSSVFHLTQTGGLVADPVNVGLQLQTGEQRARGLELDATWQATSGLGLLAGYAFIDGAVTRDTAIRVGNQLMNVPRHTGRLWAKYALPPRAFGTVAVAGGVTGQGEQQANLANSLTIPSSWITDAALFWERGRLGVQLNVVNLFDQRRPMRGAFGSTGIIPWDTRRVVLTAKTVLR
ncbi:MAG: TonB-dependent receptor [Acidobacteria bacterium]|nr:TonB-dependent receptor [Acidobacteriota bacterium]